MKEVGCAPSSLSSKGGQFKSDLEYRRLVRILRGTTIFIWFTWNE
jgi:hypothetical protein